MAEMTLTINDTHVPRVLTAIGSLMGYMDENGDPRDATAEEVRQHIIRYLKDRVQQQEMQAVIPAQVDVT